ncbi:MAG TPA: hypothetical protein VFH29_00355 [Anaerolineales bacterium]|nr:hypothetical protein [Anaerolineales bacterium]
MTSVLELLRKQPVLVLLLVLVGMAIGVPVGWATVQVVNTTPDVLRADIQEDYLRMAIDSFRVNRDPNLAVRRWDALGPAASIAFEKIQKSPAGIDPVVIVAYGEVVLAVKNSQTAPGAPTATPGPPAPAGRLIVTAAVAALIVLGLAAGAFLLRGLGRRRPRAGVAPVVDEVESDQPTPKAGRAGKTNFESLGVAPPITQNMTTYVLGDDLYDESFGIDTAGGDFLGEYGVGVSETIGIGEPKKVTALEIWLFDKNDIKTATKVLMSAHAFADSGIRGRLEAKGELIQIEPQKQILLETETLQLAATVVDLQYGDGSLPESSYFERVTLELAVWRKAAR